MASNTLTADDEKAWYRNNDCGSRPRQTDNTRTGIGVGIKVGEEVRVGMLAVTGTGEGVARIGEEVLEGDGVVVTEGRRGDSVGVPVLEVQAPKTSKAQRRVSTMKAGRVITNC